MTTAKLRGHIIAALFLGVYWSIVGLSVGAEMLPAAVVASFKTGTVDVIYPSAIKISGAEYRVQSEAKIMNHKGSEISLEEVFLRSEAKFHLNKFGEIDMMVVTRPQ